VQKISVNAGFTCPNRDGKVGRGGCTYCNNQSFVPEYCQPTKSVAQQIAEGIEFFAHKYKSQKYLVYFQSFSNTYGNLSDLKNTYNQALSQPDVAGIVIATRPDCISNELLDYLAQISENHYVMLEFGIESTNDETLRFINRGHDYQCAVNAVTNAAERGIKTCAHLILGLPNETRQTILNHAVRISQLPLTTIKLHQLQLVKNTVMAQQFAEHPEWFRLYTADEYTDLAIDFLELLKPAIAVERFVSQSPAELLIAPDWGLKNFEFNHKLIKRMAERNTWQGKKFETDKSE
jgi:radical SAM protein (TIGR01212 family)